MVISTYISYSLSAETFAVVLCIWDTGSAMVASLDFT